MLSSKKLFYRFTSLAVSLCFTFTTLGANIANAAPSQPENSAQKSSIVADIGDLPNTLPKAKLELKDKRNEYSPRYLNPDGSFTEEIYAEPKFYQDPADKKWKD